MVYGDIAEQELSSEIFHVQICRLTEDGNSKTNSKLWWALYYYLSIGLQFHCQHLFFQSNNIESCQRLVSSLIKQWEVVTHKP